MSSPGERFLLPAGLSDGLPPEAGFEAAIVERLMAAFAAWGYERVKPPLIEFEDSLLSGPGEAMAADTFRLMDPVSQRMMRSEERRVGKECRSPWLTCQSSR